MAPCMFMKISFFLLDFFVVFGSFFLFVLFYNSSFFFCLIFLGYLISISPFFGILPVFTLKSRSDSIWPSALQLHSEEMSGSVHSMHTAYPVVFLTPLIKDLLYSYHNAEDSRMAQERLPNGFSLYHDLLGLSSMYSLMTLPMKKGEQSLC